MTEAAGEAGAALAAIITLSMLVLLLIVVLMLVVRRRRRGREPEGPPPGPRRTGLPAHPNASSPVDEAFGQPPAVPITQPITTPALPRVMPPSFDDLLDTTDSAVSDRIDADSDADDAPGPKPFERKRTGITASYEPLIVGTSAGEARRHRPRWVIEFADGSTLPLEADAVIGRRPQALNGAQPLALPDPSRTLSQTHARLQLTEDGWQVEDLGSTNGVVIVRGDGATQKIEPHDPTPFDGRLLLGTLEVRVRRAGAADA